MSTNQDYSKELDRRFADVREGKLPQERKSVYKFLFLAAPITYFILLII